MSQLRRMVRLWCSSSCQADSFANTTVFGWVQVPLETLKAQLEAYLGVLKAKVPLKPMPH